MSESPAPNLRIDIWLWRARFFKTRGLAGRSVTKRGVRITRMGQMHRTKKPGASVFTTDILTFSRGSHIHTVEIVALGTRRGPAKEAQALYTDVGETEHA